MGLGILITHIGDRAPEDLECGIVILDVGLAG